MEKTKMYQARTVCEEFKEETGLELSSFMNQRGMDEINNTKGSLRGEISSAIDMVYELVNEARAAGQNSVEEIQNFFMLKCEQEQAKAYAEEEEMIKQVVSEIREVEGANLSIKSIERVAPGVCRVLAKREEKKFMLFRETRSHILWTLVGNDLESIDAAKQLRDSLIAGSCDPIPTRFMIVAQVG